MMTTEKSILLTIPLLMKADKKERRGLILASKWIVVGLCAKLGRGSLFSGRALGIVKENELCLDKVQHCLSLNDKEALHLSAWQPIKENQ